MRHFVNRKAKGQSGKWRQLSKDTVTHNTGATYPHTGSTVHHHAIVHGVVRKPRYQGTMGHSPTRAASRGLCVHHQAIVRAPAGLSYQAWQRSTSRQPRASLHSARSCASDMRRGPVPRGEEYSTR